VLKHFLDDEALSTAAPSTEQSPEIPLLVSNLEAWPALPKVECGWEVCHEALDAEEIWEGLPEPAVAIEGLPQSLAQRLASWWVVSDNDTTDPSTLKDSGLAEDEEVAKATFADLLRDHQGAQAPPACGALMPPLHRSIALPHKVVATEPDEYSDLPDRRGHGWKKDKASWNTKQRLRVAHQKEQKQRQSQQSCNLMDKEEEGSPE